VSVVTNQFVGLDNVLAGALAFERLDKPGHLNAGCPSLSQLVQAWCRRQGRLNLCSNGASFLFVVVVVAPFICEGFTFDLVAGWNALIMFDRTNN
jgi:hypothetical protein